MNQNWAVIFDWDGVIIDSSSAHQRSWLLLAKEERRELPADHHHRTFGMKNHQIIPEVLRWATDPGEIERIAWRKEELYRELVAAEGIQPLPGVRDFLQLLKQAGIPCAIGSSTPRVNIEFVLDRIHCREYFDVIVAADDVTHGKPAPDIFLLAARKLGVAPERCVVFEDAHVGIEAARAAGMRVIACATTHPADTLRDADRVVSSLAEVTLAELNADFIQTPTAPPPAPPTSAQSN